MGSCGDMRTMSPREVLDGQRRREFARKLDAGEWSDLKPCSTCRWDKCGHVGLGVRNPALEEPSSQEPAVETVSNEEATMETATGEATDSAAELRAVHASTSWRFTAPLRATSCPLCVMRCGPCMQTATAFTLHTATAVARRLAVAAL